MLLLRHQMQYSIWNKIESFCDFYLFKFKSKITVYGGQNRDFNCTLNAFIILIKSTFTKTKTTGRISDMKVIFLHVSAQFPTFKRMRKLRQGCYFGRTCHVSVKWAADHAYFTHCSTQKTVSFCLNCCAVNVMENIWKFEYESVGAGLTILIRMFLSAKNIFHI